jgi:hypothetical protein
MPTVPELRSRVVLKGKPASMLLSQRPQQIAVACEADAAMKAYIRALPEPRVRGAQLPLAQTFSDASGPAHNFSAALARYMLFHAGCTYLSQHNQCG